MSIKFFQKLYKAYLKYLSNRTLKYKDDKAKFIIPVKDLFYNKHTNQFYVKLVTITGYISRDITVEEILSNKNIFESLDINSRYYVYCVSGRLEELANNEQNSIYTFHGISPHDSNIFIVKSMLDMSIHKWNIIDAYKQELYYNLDKGSMARFIERYFIAKTQSSNIENNNNSALRLIK